MAERGGNVHDVHARVVVGFHGEGKIIPHHILLAQKIGGRDPLCPGIVAGKQPVLLSQPLHGVYGLLPDVSPADEKAVLIPLKLPRKGVQLPDDMVSHLDELPVRIGPLRPVRHIGLVKFGSVIEDEAVPGHDHEYQKKPPGIGPAEKRNEPPPSSLTDENTQNAGCRRRCGKQDGQNDHPLSHGKGKDRHQPSVDVDGKRKQMPDMPVAERPAVPGKHVHRRRQKK